MPAQDNKEGHEGDFGTPSIELSQAENAIHLRPSLKEVIATEVLKLFRYSLFGTLSFAGSLALIDAVFIGTHIITPDQRLMSGSIVMTFVTATVVQVGAALAAIVFAVFRENPSES